MTRGRAFVAVSHKGGTGRSVGIANTSFHLAMQGKNVCIVDLDLASSTLGAVFQLQGMETGVRGISGTHDLLRQPLAGDVIMNSLLDLWDSDLLSTARNPNVGRFRLLPGNRMQGDLEMLIDDLVDPLRHLLESLCSGFDIVIADVRSGISTVFQALCNIGSPYLAGWLVFHRWTPQHLAGAAEFVQNLTTFEQPTYTIRTAYITPDYERNDEQARYFRHQDSLLESSEKEFVSHANTRARVQCRRLTSIPLTPILQWEERILTRDFAHRVGAMGAFDAFAELATELNSIAAQVDE